MSRHRTFPGHARLAPERARFRPGDPLDIDRDLVRYDEHPAEPWLQRANATVPTYMEQHFWGDGTVRISGREYNGLGESACATRGDLSCLSCHRMHGSPPDDQLRPVAENEAVCTTCHEPARYGVAHTHHAPDSPGSRCYNCHMPYTTLGLLKAIRSHRIDSPRATTTVATGRPDACSVCHLDKPIAWTAERLTAWYGQPPVATTDDDRNVAAALLWLLRGDAAQRDVVAWALGWPDAQRTAGTSWMAPFLSLLLDDPYAAVRFNAGRSLRSLPGFEDVEYDYLGDSRRQVAQQVLRRWRPGDRRDASLLMTPDGTPDSSAIALQRRRRDDRPVSLAE
jgi:predicted CXXCH cytochrome family protein